MTIKICVRMYGYKYLNELFSIGGLKAMAFNKKNRENVEKNNIKKALEEAESPKTSFRNIEIKKKEVREKKVRYQFMLQPSVRKKLEQLVKENNYPSSSEFVNDLIKRL